VNSTGGNIIDKNPLATDILNTPEIQQQWVAHIVSKFGNSAKSGIIYQMDNEVSNWAYLFFGLYIFTRILIDRSDK
jgi:Glycoside hydrolase family 44